MNKKVILSSVFMSAALKASYSLLLQVTYPLAESGYYVLPVAVVDETFKQNGLSIASDIHALSTANIWC